MLYHYERTNKKILAVILVGQKKNDKSVIAQKARHDYQEATKRNKNCNVQRAANQKFDFYHCKEIGNQQLGCSREC